MKFLRMWKDIKFKKIYKSDKSTYYLTLNNTPIEKIRAISFSTHHEAFKRIRDFSTPNYEVVYFMRNKKAFNTLFFNMNYDVVITNAKSDIIKCLINVERGTISKHYKNGFNIFFFTVGSIKNYEIKEKDSLRVHNEIFSFF